MVTQEATAQRHYDPDSQGAWDRQLPHADLVDQLPPPVERKTGGPLDRDEWRRSNATEVGHAAYKLLDVLCGYSNTEGQCWPGMELLAEVSGMSARALRRGLAELRRKQIVWPLYPGSTVCKANPYQLAGGLNRWDCAESCTTIVPKVAHRTLSSSEPKRNPKERGSKRERGPEPKPLPTGVLNSFSFEEEKNRVRAESTNGVGLPSKPGTAPIPTPTPSLTPNADQTTREDVERFVWTWLPETPRDAEQIKWLGKHCWSVWSKHWELDFDGAMKVWTKDDTSRRKFRQDVVMHLVKVGLPKPVEPDPENELAKKRTAEIMDRQLAEAPGRVVRKECTGCGKTRQLDPGVSMCYGCRKESGGGVVIDEGREIMSRYRPVFPIWLKQVMR